MNEKQHPRDASFKKLYTVSLGGHAMNHDDNGNENELEKAYGQLVQELGTKCSEEELWELAKERAQIWQEGRLAYEIYQKEGRPIGTSLRMWRLEREARKEASKNQ